MGACAFCHLVEGKNINEVFDRLVSEAIREEGDGSYNGTISTCSLNGRASKKYSEYSKENEEKALRWIEEEERYGEKWTADYVDLGVCAYEVISVKKKTVKPTAEFKMQYCVYEEGDYYKERKLLAHKDTKKAADDVALKYALEGKDVVVEKGYVKIKGNAQTTEFEIVKKRYDKKPKLKETDTRKIIPVRKFYVYGWAAC